MKLLKTKQILKLGPVFSFFFVIEGYDDIIGHLFTLEKSVSQHQIESALAFIMGSPSSYS